MTKTDKHNSMKKVGIMEKMTQLKDRKITQVQYIS